MESTHRGGDPPSLGLRDRAMRDYLYPPGEHSCLPTRGIPDAWYKSHSALSTAHRHRDRRPRARLTASRDTDLEGLLDRDDVIAQLNAVPAHRPHRRTLRRPDVLIDSRDELPGHDPTTP